MELTPTDANSGQVRECPLRSLKIDKSAEEKGEDDHSAHRYYTKIRTFLT
jgi:hypothetical protein